MNEQNVEMVWKYICGELKKRDVLSSVSEKEFRETMKDLGYNFRKWICAEILVPSQDEKFWRQLHQIYLDGKSIEDIAQEFGLSWTAISKYFHKFNLSIRLHKESSINCLEKVKRTNLEKYGVEHAFQSEEVKDKINKTNLERYGFERPAQNKDVVEKAKQTCRKKYGVDFSLQAKEVREKIKNTNIERYGATSPAGYKKVCDKMKNTCMERYGVDNYFKYKPFRQNLRDNLINKKTEVVKLRIGVFGYELIDKYDGARELNDGSGHIKCKKYLIKHIPCGTEFYDDVFNIPHCPKCFKVNGTSVIQEFYRKFIEDLGFKVISSYRGAICNPQNNYPWEIDLYLPDLKIGFEVDTLLYHCVGHERSNKYPTYHRDKTNEALKSGIKLYHIWDHLNPEIVKSKISYILGKVQNKVGARQLTLKSVSNAEGRAFFEENHLYDGVNASLYFGLYRGEELLSCISFRKYDKESLEIARFASKVNSLVNGAFSRLFAYALAHIKEKYSHIKQIITYADRDWSPDSDTTYMREGFTLIGDSGASLFYTDLGNVYSRQMFQKWRLAEIFPDTYDENLTEQEILFLNGIYPLYTSGNWKYSYKI